MKIMVYRKIQFQNGSCFAVIPRALLDAVGLKAGDKVCFGIEDGKIVLFPFEADD